MRSLLYPVHLIVKFGIILYDNELPGKSRSTKAYICENAEHTPQSSTTKPAVPESVNVEPPNVLGPEHVAFVGVRQELTCSHHILFGRSIACGNIQTNTEETLIGASTQNAATRNPSGSPLSGLQTGEKSVAEASTQTNEAGIVDSSSNDIASLPTTLVKTPTDLASAVGLEANGHQDEARCEDGSLEAQNEEEQMWRMQKDFLLVENEVILEQDRSSNNLDQTQEENTGIRVPLEFQGHVEGHNARATLIEEETVEESQDVTEDVGSTSMVEDALSTEIAAHQRTREELDQLQEQITTKNNQIQTANENYLRLLRQSEESHQQLEEERDNLLEKLDETNSRILELEESTDGEHMRRLESQIEYLKAAAERMWEKITEQHNLIRVGCKDLSFYIRLGTKLHARLKKVDRILKGSRWMPSSIRGELDSADRLMRLAEKWFPIGVPAKNNLREIQLAIEGPPAGFSELPTTETIPGQEGGVVDTDTEQLVSNVIDYQGGEADDNGQIVDVEAEGPALNTFDFSNTEDMAPDAAPISTLEDTSMEPGSLFSPGAPAREIWQETQNTAKNPVFTFGETPAPDSRPKAQCRAKKPVFRSTATPAQAVRQEVPSEVTTSPQGVSFLQQTAVPDVTGVRSVQEGLQVEAKWDDVEEQTEGPTKKSRTTSIHEAATSVDLSFSSFTTKEASSNKKTKKTSIFDQAASINLSSPSSGSTVEATTRMNTASVFDAAASIKLSPQSSGNGAPLGASFDHDPKRTSEAPISIYTPTFNFSETAAKGEEKEQEPAPRTVKPPMLGLGTPTQFAFSPTGIRPKFGGSNSNAAGASNSISDRKPVVVGGKDEQSQESTKKDANALSSTTEAFGKFGPPAASEKVSLDQFNLRTAGASEVQPNAFSPPSRTGGVGGHDGQNPDPNEDSGFLYEIEDGFEAPTKEPAKAEHVNMSPASARVPAAKNEGEAVSSELTQGSSSDAPTQLPGLSVSSDSSQPVQSSPIAQSGTGSGVNRQRSEDRRGDKDSEGEVQEVTGTSSVKTSRTSSTAPSASEGRVEGEASGLLGTLGFDVAALTRIVSSVRPGVLEKPGVVDNLNGLFSRGAKPASQIEDDKVERHVWPGSGRTAAEIISSCEAECHERAEPMTASVPWREPEWPAALPPLGGPQPKLSAEFSPLAALSRTATATYKPPVSSRASMSSLEAIEEGIRYAMGAIESLHIGPAAPPAILQKLDAEKHLLSGDWIARRYTIRRVLRRQADDVGKKIETRARTEEDRATEAICRDKSLMEQEMMEIEPQVTESPTLTRAEMEDVARVLNTRGYGRVARVIGRQQRHGGRRAVRGHESQVPGQPEMGKEEVSLTPVEEAQEATVSCEQERSMEPEVVVESEPKETDSATTSSERVETQAGPQIGPQERPQMRVEMALQMRPHMGMPMELRMEETASTAEISRESQEQTKDTTPKKPSKGLRLWSLKTKR